VEHNDVARIVATAAAAVFPDDPPSFVQRVPHGHGDPRALERDLRTAGFTDIVWNVVALRSRAACARAAAIGIGPGTPLRPEITMRDPGRLDDVVERATRDLREAFGDGAIDAQMRAYVFTARVAGRRSPARRRAPRRRARCWRGGAGPPPRGGGRGRLFPGGGAARGRRWRGGGAGAGAGLQSMLTTDLTAVTSIAVVERARLGELRKELKLSRSAWADPQTALRVGKLAGATHLVTGSFAIVGGKLRLDARVVAIAT